MNYGKMSDLLNVSDILNYYADDAAAIATMLDNARTEHDDDHRRMDDFIRIAIMALSALAGAMHQAAENSINRKEG